MPAPRNPQLAIVRQWVEKAEHDLTAAGQIQKLGKDAPTDTVCFHAQQCVEKYLKAALVNQGIPFAKTHDIEVLMKLIPPRHRPAMTPTEQKLFTSYAVVVLEDGLFFGLLQPPVARHLSVVLIGFAVAVLPLIKLAGGEA